MEYQYAIFSHSNEGCDRNEIWHKCSLGGEDDVQTSNTRIVERNCAIPHSMMKNMTYVTETRDV